MQPFNFKPEKSHTMKKIFLILAPALLATACDLDYYPSNAMTSDQLQENPSSAVYSTDGNYSMFKDVLPYKGTEYSGNSYVRHYFQMSEFRGDNVTLAHKTEDPLYNEMCYSDLVTDQPNSYMWWCAYHIIYAANSIIESLPEGVSGEYDHMLGENYFMRALCHLHLTTLYAKPYTMGRENPGVILRTSTVTDVTVRATVGDVYDQIRDDLIKAAELMAADESRVTNHGYISHDAALGLLSRVYLYRDENDKVIETVNTMAQGSAAYAHLDPDCENYFANALTSPETLWAVAHVATLENRGRESIGSMYYTADAKGVSGWAEMYYSDPLVKLFQRHPEDRRYTGYCIPLEPVEGKMSIRWTEESADNTFRLNNLRDVEWDQDKNQYYFEENGQTIYVTEKQVGPDKKYYIQWEGSQTEVYLDQKMFAFNTCPAFMCAKFTGQDGEPMLSSPVMIRWAEVILNRAEAYAKTPGNEQQALDDVNALRSRAGLSGDALYTLSNYKDAGYDNVLDLVLDERRMELCYEGHRAFDVYRNKLKMDRRFAGVQAWEEIDHTDNRIQYRIPYDEISVSGIPQND